MIRNTVPAFQGLSARQADLALLILESQDIDAWIHKDPEGWTILTAKEDLDRARALIRDHNRETVRSSIPVKTAPDNNPFLSLPAFLIMGMLSVIHVLSVQIRIHEDLILTYGASALHILTGQNYRAVTALFLHADAGHLLGNLGGILLFGAPLIRLSGFGTGPLMLLVTGTLGNLMTAGLYRNAHLAVGASTAVMGAAGLLASFQITRNDRPPAVQSVVPLFAAALLVALFSQGERTDVFAHFFGFISGLILGLVFFPLNRVLSPTLKDPIALMISLAILAGAAWSGQVCFFFSDARH